MRLHLIAAFSIVSLASFAHSQDATKPTPRVSPTVTCDDASLLQKIHDHIVATSKAEAGQDGTAAAYSETITRTGVKFDLVPISGGKFTMGSPEDEPERLESEGPQREVNIEPFWMGRTEVTWDEYEPFMITQVDREKHGGRKDYDPTVHDMVDGISQPTPPYTEMSFGMGQSGFPAISMTQHAANKYCQWLSAQTGHFYRLPTEAEWEYAARAGTTTPFSFPEDQIDEYAWYFDNSEDKYQLAGTKKPNPWGLHDMHGNVTEWTADQYIEDYFQTISDGATNPLMAPTKIDPRTVRGGSWFDDPFQLRSAYRIGSDPEWKVQDPQLPKSIWYHTDAPWLGFRVVRPQAIPTLEQLDAAWNSATGKK